MARDLAVGAVLTGSVRQSGSQVRVTGQLLAAPAGETMWTEQYDRTVANIFDAQSDIALRVGARPANLARARGTNAAPVHPTQNAAAYELYTQQRRFSMVAQAPNEQGIELLRQAIALDPQFALAYAVLSGRLRLQGSTVTWRADHLRALEAAEKAVQLDPFLSRGMKSQRRH